MELDDDGRREFDGARWLPDTGCLLCILSAAIYLDVMRGGESAQAWSVAGVIDYVGNPRFRKKAYLP